VIVNQERQLLFSGLLEDEEGTTGTGHVDDLLPEPGANAGADVSDVHAGGQLEKPLGEMAP